MLKFKLFIIVLLINFAILSNSAKAALLIDKRPYYVFASVQTISSDSQVLYSAFTLPDSAAISKFNWWGGNKDNINWKLSFFEGILNQQNKLDLGNLVYQNTFSGSELVNKYKDTNYSHEYFYSYELNKDLILEGNKNYFVSIEALINNDRWGWTLNSYYGNNIIAIHPFEERKSYSTFSPSYQLEGISPSPVPEPSTMLLGLISLTGLLGSKKRKFK